MNLWQELFALRIALQKEILSSSQLRSLLEACEKEGVSLFGYLENHQPELFRALEDCLEEAEKLPSYPHRSQNVLRENQLLFEKLKGKVQEEKLKACLARVQKLSSSGFPIRLHEVLLIENWVSPQDLNKWLKWKHTEKLACRQCNLYLTVEEYCPWRMYPCPLCAKAMPPAKKRSSKRHRRAEPQATGKFFGDYQLLRLLGQGGMGKVYLAQTREGEEVALKMLQPHAMNPRTQKRFQREIEICQRLQHPHILPILDWGKKKGVFYYTMPYLRGGSLRQYIKKHGPMPEEEVLELAQPLCEALEAAHRQGVVHRDLKPDNILLDEERQPYIVDFGLAKVLVNYDISLTQSGTVIGSPEFMPPEQAKGKKNVDPRSDVYSLGATMYFLLAGQPPFQGNEFMELVFKVIMESPEPLRQVAPQVSPSLAKVIHKCLQKEPEKRFSSALELSQALQEVKEKRGSFAKTISRRLSQRERWREKESPTGREREWRRSSPAVVGVSLLALLLSALGLWTLFSSSSSGKPKEHTSGVKNSQSTLTPERFLQLLQKKWQKKGRKGLELFLNTFPTPPKSPLFSIKKEYQCRLGLAKILEIRDPSQKQTWEKGLLSLWEPLPPSWLQRLVLDSPHLWETHTPSILGPRERELLQHLQEELALWKSQEHSSRGPSFFYLEFLLARLQGDWQKGRRALLLLKETLGELSRELQWERARLEVLTQHWDSLQSLLERIEQEALPPDDRELWNCYQQALKVGQTPREPEFWKAMVPFGTKGLALSPLWRKQVQHPFLSPALERALLRTSASWGEQGVSLAFDAFQKRPHRLSFFWNECSPELQEKWLERNFSYFLRLFATLPLQFQKVFLRALLHLAQKKSPKAEQAHSLIAELAEKSPTWQVVLFQQLSRDPSLFPLFHALWEKNPDMYDQQTSAFQILLRYSRSKHLPLWEKSLTSSRPRARYWSAWALLHFRRLSPVLEYLRRHPQDEFVWSALLEKEREVALALRQWKSRLERSRPSPSTLAFMAQLLGRCSAKTFPQRVKSLLRLLEHPSSEVRLQAAQSLQKLSASERTPFIKVLRKKLEQEPDPEVRRALSRLF